MIEAAARAASQLHGIVILRDRSTVGRFDPLAGNHRQTGTPEPADVPAFDVGAGNARVNRAPPPGLSATVTLPPCAFMISLTIARPKPAPSFFGPLPRQKRSKMCSRSCNGTPLPRSAMLTRPSA